MFADAGLDEPLGIVCDRASGNFFVANQNSNTTEKFSFDGTDLGIFVRTKKAPHFLTLYQPSMTQVAGGH